MARQILTPRFTVRPYRPEHNPGVCRYLVFDELREQPASETLFTTYFEASQACAVANDVAVSVYLEMLEEMSGLREEIEEREVTP